MNRQALEGIYAYPFRNCSKTASQEILFAEVTVSLQEKSNSKQNNDWELGIFMTISFVNVHLIICRPLVSKLELDATKMPYI